MMTQRNVITIALMATLMTISPPSLEAFVITVFPGSTFDTDTEAMNATLGISGFHIEDFEDVNLLPGLTVETTNPNSGPTGTLPQTYLEGNGSFTNNAWDGTHALVNTSTNDIWHGGPGGTLTHLVAEKTTFHLANPARSFGVGLGNFQTNLVDHAVLINGVAKVDALENVSGFTSGINLRNGYLRIDAEPGESILSVTIEMRANGTQSPVNDDGLIFDHVAFTQLPEPSTGAVVGTLLLGVTAARRRRVA